MRVAKLESRVEGLVRVMHPEIGMGVEFRQTSDQQRKDLEKFIHALKHSNGVQPELVVEPEGMNDVESGSSKPLASDELEDPLLELFQRNTELTADAFRDELRAQRNPHLDVAETVSA
jgi:hypothetical protein